MYMALRAYLGTWREGTTLSGIGVDVDVGMRGMRMMHIEMTELKSW